MSESDEIDDIRRLETAGKKLDSQKVTAAERQKLLKAVRKAFKHGDERAFMSIIREAGLKDGSPEFLRAVEEWRKNQRNG